MIVLAMNVGFGHLLRGKTVYQTHKALAERTWEGILTISGHETCRDLALSWADKEGKPHGQLSAILRVG